MQQHRAEAEEPPKNKIGVKRDVWDAGDKAEKQPANDHDDRIRHSDSSSKKSENDDRKEQKKKDEFDLANFTHRAQRNLLEETESTGLDLAFSARAQGIRTTLKEIT
jgi:hypothetical protein